MARRLFKRGEWVAIMLPVDDISITADMMKLNGCQAIIDTVLRNKKSEYSYTLEGVVTKAGKPYWFLPEWLIPIER